MFETLHSCGLELSTSPGFRQKLGIHHYWWILLLAWVAYILSLTRSPQVWAVQWAKLLAFPSWDDVSNRSCMTLSPDERRPEESSSGASEVTCHLIQASPTASSEETGERTALFRLLIFSLVGDRGKWQSRTWISNLIAGVGFSGYT